MDMRVQPKRDKQTRTVWIGVRARARQAAGAGRHERMPL
jgi:hypothetical protein